MEQRKAIQKAIRQNYAILIKDFKATFCTDCCWYEADHSCRKDLLPVTSNGEPCPYFCSRFGEALQSKSTGIEQLV